MEEIQDIVVTETPIQKFYSEQNIFITGGTGFIGKTLIEKLLRSCKSIDTIYLLIRAKKGKNLHSRLEELFEDPVFEKLREINPKFQHKVQGINGDCSLPGFGLSLTDRQLLISKVSIVFHVAATVKFDEKLRLAVAINLMSPRDILQLCREMKHLKSVVHVSTAYANCTNSYIDEKFYPTPMDANKLKSLVDSTDDKLLDNITPMILNEWPNTYTFTKAVAEDLIRTEFIDLPVGVFRPAIVISTYKEPLVGWVDNMYGPTGICMGAGTGFLHTLPCDPAVSANTVPADMCVNALVCSAWQVHKNHQEIIQQNKEKTEKDIPIYNYVSSVDKRINWKRFMHLSESKGIDYPSIRAIWYYTFTLNKYYPIHLLYVLFLQLIPSLIVDGTLICIGKPPQMLKMHRKIMKFSNILYYFTTRDWVFTNSSVKRLYNELEDKDKSIFYFHMKDLNWEEFFKSYLLGIRIYLLKDPLKTLDEAKRRWRRLYWLNQATKFVFTILMLRLMWYVYSVVI